MNYETDKSPEQDQVHLQAKFVIGCSDEDFDEEYDEDEIKHIVPPDGGWGWIVVLASFMCNAVVDGVILTSGMLYPNLRVTFGATNSEVAWISSLLGGTYLLAGPFVSALSNAFGFRIVCIVGSVICSISCAVSYFATSIYFLYVSFGILGGIGLGFVYVPAVVAPGFYFEKRRALATGMAVCGSGIGTFVMSPFITFLLAKFGDDWQLIFFVFSGIILSCAFFGLAFRPLTAATGKTVKRSDDGLEVPGTPLLIRIKRARDQELAQCPSALSMYSEYSRTPSKVTLDGLTEAKPLSMAKTLIERQGMKRLSYPGIVITGPKTEPILEESETVSNEQENNKSKNGSLLNSTTSNGQYGSSLNCLQDEDKLSTPNLVQHTDGDGQNSEINGKLPIISVNSVSNTNLDNVPEQNGVNNPEYEKTVIGDQEDSKNLLTVPNRARIMSTPNFKYHIQTMALPEYSRRPSRVSLSNEVSRPFYRDDIFYSGSLARIPQYRKNSTNTGAYHASVTHLPPMDVLAAEEEGQQSSCISCGSAVKYVLLKIFDFSLLSSVTFLILCASGFFALTSLFVPFNFLPSYAEDSGLSTSDTTFLMSLIGICNTFGRIGAGWVADHPKVDALMVNSLALITGGLATVVLPFLRDPSLLYCYAITFGLSIAAFASLRSVILVELLGLEKLTSAFGLILLFQGLAAAFGSPIAGAFVDMTGEYKISFFLFGGLFTLSGVLCFPLRLVKRWEERRIDERLRKEKYGL